MTVAWDLKSIDEVAFIQEGPGIRKYEYQEGGYPMINVRCVQNGYIDMTSARAANRDLAEGKWAHFQIDAGDILFTISGTIGRCAIVCESDLPILMNTSVVRFKPTDPNLELRFLYYFLQSEDFQGPLKDLSSGAAIQNVGPTHIKTLSIPCPPAAQQKRIVAVLDQAFAALDRARAHAEANLSDAQELFDNTLLATFDELVSNAAMMTLSDAANDFSRGKSRHRPRNDPKLYDGEYPFIQTGDIRRSEGSIREYSQTYNEAGLAQSKLWPVGTVCITIAANIAETGVLEFEGCFPDSVIGMVPSLDLANAHYVEYMLRYFAKELKLQGKGSAQDNINLATFENAKFPFPSLEQQTAVVDKLDSVATEVAGLRSNYQQKLADLANLRQSILQKAFSGQLA